MSAFPEEIQLCDCSECMNSGDPADQCAFDCDADDMCVGCREGRLKREEDEWERNKYW